MQQAAVYDLLVAKPHTPDESRYAPEAFGYYRDGYHWALVMALRVMNAATQRYELVRKTKQLDARRRRAEGQSGK